MQTPGLRTPHSLCDRGHPPASDTSASTPRKRLPGASQSRSCPCLSSHPTPAPHPGSRSKRKLLNPRVQPRAGGDGKAVRGGAGPWRRPQASVRSELRSRGRGVAAPGGPEAGAGA